MQSYSKEFKDEIVKKALTFSATEIKDLAKGIGIPYSTVYYWVASKKKMKANNHEIEDNKKLVRPQNWSAEAKLQAIIKTADMSQEELGAYCREKGLYTHHLQEWKERFIEGMKATANKNSGEIHKMRTEMKQLKSELHRKDKALAETSALLILKKKANLIWGDGEDA